MQELRGAPARSPTPSAWAADAADVALTTGTSDGIVRVLRGLRPRARRRGPHRATTSTRACSGRWPRCAHRTGVDGPHRALRRAGRRRRAPDAARRLLARELGDRRARAPTGLAAPDDVPVLLDGAQGVGRDPGRRGGAGLRVLRGRRAEVALRAGRHRPAVDRARVARAPRAAGRDVSATWPSRARPGLARCSPTRAATTRPRSPTEASAAAVAAHDVLGGRGLGRGPRARDGRWPPGSPIACASAAAPSHRAATRRSSPGRTPTPQDAATAWPRRASSSATSPARGYLRASVGAWNDDGDLERLLAGLR